MDIDLFWTLGGWFLGPNCMATPRTSVHALLLFVSIILIVLLFALPAEKLKTASSLRSGRLRLDSATTTFQSTMKLHPQQTKNTHTSSSSASTSRQFKAGEHEVPSGPNPISNR
ncbi:hypothetical protein HHK36_022367 [Tetracentron sinense]|uniref:Uncharacterized protein n=1 Tax=Tetracentron sinense TaxID=13715 RepID=A0A835D8S0_TETSI|nr:hypothetical protein HHK36_022367 [Tetracentron sinense]